MLCNADLLPGTKVSKWYAPKEEAIPFDVIVTNHDGKPIADQIVRASAERSWSEYKEDAQVRSFKYSLFLFFSLSFSFSVSTFHLMSLTCNIAGYVQVDAMQ